MTRNLALLSLAALFLQSVAAYAQTTDSSIETGTGSSLTYAQQQAIQQQITNGITNGTLSQAQIDALQNQLSTGRESTANLRGSPLDQPGIPRGEEIRPLGQNNVPNNNSPIDRRTTTGPDPFTYNTLGPDAYQSQKYQNPAYNVPAYPTTDPQAPGTQQQYSAPSAGTPYGAGYGQAPYAGTTSGQGQGVYVYRPNAAR